MRTVLIVRGRLGTEISVIRQWMGGVSVFVVGGGSRTVNECSARCWIDGSGGGMGRVVFGVTMSEPWWFVYTYLERKRKREGNDRDQVTEVKELIEDRFFLGGVKMSTVALR